MNRPAAALLPVRLTSPSRLSRSTKKSAPIYLKRLLRSILLIISRDTRKPIFSSRKAAKAAKGFKSHKKRTPNHQGERLDSDNRQILLCVLGGLCAKPLLQVNLRIQVKT